MIRVFEGGDGCTRGGRSERSRVSGDLDPEDAREREGDGIVAFMCREWSRNFAVIVCV
jgi:hypothetical protein